MSLSAKTLRNLPPTLRKAVEHAAKLDHRQKPFGYGPSQFNHYVLGRGPYWWRQRQIAQSVKNTPVTLVPTGNSVGKTYLAAGLILWFLYEHPGSLVISTAPTQTQLEEVLWKEVRRAWQSPRKALAGTCLKSPLKIEVAPGWQALGYSTTKTERLSGHHAEHLLAVIDEASGVEPEIIEAIDSLNPSRLLMIGNPLRPDGPFYERCQRPGEFGRVIQIASLESPDIALERSARGLADATWLAKARNDYGEGSAWWKSHVLGEFPDAASDTVIPRDWIDRAATVEHRRSGPTRTAIDLAEGNGGDRSVVMTRDDNGILQIEHSPRWSLETTATKAALQVQRWGVEHHRVSWDQSGIGADFANRLRAVGIHAAKGYRGGASGGDRFANLRSAAAWTLRQRLDPTRTVPVLHGPPIVQPPFSIRPEWLTLMRDELQGLRYTQTHTSAVALEPKEDLMKRLRKSPDFADTLIQSWAFPG